jgi:glycosyltransferase involved in cell wall biosynthesis
MKLTVVLPTLFAELLPEAIDAAHAAADGLEREILVVSPFDPGRHDVRWVADPSPRGSIAAANAGFAAARGDIVALASDDTRLTQGALAAAVARLAALPGGMAGFPRVVGGDAYIGTVYGHYYPYYFALARATLDRVGPFDEGYRKHYADPDLAMRIWASGGRCEFLRDAAVVDIASRGTAGEAPDKTLGSRAADFARFAGAWGPKFDRAWEEEEGGINLDLALNLVQLASGDTVTCALVDPARIFDLRVLSGLSLVGLNHQTKIGLGRAAQALDYLRWLMSLDPSPFNIAVGRGNRAVLAKPF